MNSLQESSWLAGIMEGEGTFCAGKTGKERNKLCVKLQMTDLDIVERAIEIMPTTCKLYIRKPKKVQHKESYEIAWLGVNAENLMRRIYSYMGIRRKEKIDELLAMNLSHHTKVKV